MTTPDPRNTIAGWCFTAQEISDALSNGHMPNPSIDLSNPCNLNCPYCYVEEKNSRRKVRKPNELTFEETLAVIDDLAASRAKTINIVGAGEPTIDPHFNDVIEYIHKKGVWIVLFTNGIALANNPALVRHLYQCEVSVVLKMNSFSPEIQDLVSGREGYAKKRDSCLDLLLDSGFGSHEPTRIAADIMVFKGNLEEIPRIHGWCRANNVFPIAGEFIPTGRTEGGTFQGLGAISEFDEDRRQRIGELLQPISASERLWLAAQLAAIDKRHGIGRNSNFAYYGGGICTQILGLYIDIEGNIWPCVARKRREGSVLVGGLLGNVRRGDLPSRVWKEHPYMTELRRGFDGGCPYKAPLRHELVRVVSNETQF
jgi:MoaA/NifB/PqqE/SkfB family radical SAM enzyme